MAGLDPAIRHLEELTLSPCGRGWRRRRRVRGSCRRRRTIDRATSASAISQKACVASPQMPKLRCGDCCGIGDSRDLNSDGKFHSKTTFLILYASSGASLSKSTAASTRVRNATWQGISRYPLKAFGLCATGIMTYCNGPGRSWKTFSQSSPSRERPLTRRLTS